MLPILGEPGTTIDVSLAYQQGLQGKIAQDPRNAERQNTHLAKKKRAGPRSPQEAVISTWPSISNILEWILFK